MPGVSIVTLAEKYPKASEREDSVPWLLAFDRNQDGVLEKDEVQGPEGHFRCDWLGDRLNVRRWRNFEAILLESGLVERRRPKACGVLVERKKSLPVAPVGRFPAAYSILFFAQPFDRAFSLTREAELDKMLEVLKPRTTLVAREPRHVEVMLDSGRRVRFDLTRGGGLSEIHYFDADGQDSWLARLEFLQVFRDAGVFDDYFSKNPYLAEEQDAWLRLNSPIVTARDTPTLSLEELEKKSWRGVLLFPDLHGNKARYRKLYRLLESEQLDWFALEMFSHRMQLSLDDFLSAAEGSEKFLQAKKKIQQHLAPFWNPYFKDLRDPDDSPYYRLLLLCRERKIRVIGLDAMGYYSFASRRFAPLTIGARNAVWAKQIPTRGRGIVFGGQAHYTSFRKARVQDFLWDIVPKRTVQLLSFEADNKKKAK
ncbi:MAG: hypothetical protein U1F66_09830 [bacterium]